MLCIYLQSIHIWVKNKLTRAVLLSLSESLRNINNHTLVSNDNMSIIICYTVFHNKIHANMCHIRLKQPEFRAAIECSEVKWKFTVTVSNKIKSIKRYFKYKKNIIVHSTNKCFWHIIWLYKYVLLYYYYITTKVIKTEFAVLRKITAVNLHKKIFSVDSVKHRQLWKNAVLTSLQ